MSFEPIFDECLECNLYHCGDGKSTISGCQVEEGEEPPSFCPMSNYDPWQDWRDEY